MSEDVSIRSTLLTADQYMLHETISKFAADHFPIDVLLGDPLELDSRRESAWRDLSAMGLTGLLVAEHDGGSGGSLSDACVVAEALAAELAPLPFVAVGIAGASILRYCDGSVDDLRRLAEGAKYSVLVDRTFGWPPRVDVVAWGWGSGARLIGLDESGRACAYDAETRAVDEWFDFLHPVAEVIGASASTVEGNAGATRALAMARVGCAAQLLGVASRAMDEAVSYAKQREQYGQLIGSFQAVQHLCAEMLVDVETSRSVVYGSAAMVEEASSSDAERAGAVAKAWVSEAALRVCETSIQVLGGIGITREHPAHLRLRDAHLFARALGRPNEIYRQLAQQQLAMSEGS